MERRDTNNSEHGKVPYQAPQLITYGNVRDITLATGKNRQTDNGAAPNRNTLA